MREGLVERLKGEPLDSGRYRTVIVEGLFTAEEDQKQWVGASVVFANGDEGVFGLWEGGQSPRLTRRGRMRRWAKNATAVPAWWYLFGLNVLVLL